MRERSEQNARTLNVNDRERWASMIGGSALVLSALRRRTWGNLGLALLGADLVYRGATGHCHLYQALGISTASHARRGANSVPYGAGIRVERAVTINKSPEELYRFWRNLENLPRFMKHLESVKVLDGKRSHWVAKAPAGRTVEWDAVIVNEIENQLIGWRSLENAHVDNAGSVHFKAAPGGRGTELSIELEYSPPGGMVGSLVAKLFGEEPEQQIAEDLYRFKQLMETGEIATTEGQSTGRGKRSVNEFEQARQKRLGSTKRKDVVQQASEESFPASDAPAWTVRAEGAGSH